MRPVSIICLALLLAPGLQAAPLTEARVTKIIRIVDVIDPAKGAHPAALSEVIKDQIGLRIGSKSRSELLFDDNTLTRIGPETYSSFKAGALGYNGTLNVGGGSIDAATAIKLYAGGSNGSVNFADNVTLSGNSLKIIAADTVTIFNNKVVTVLGPGPANVFTNVPNSSGFGGNGSTTGTCGGNGALAPQPFGLAPGY